MSYSRRKLYALGEPFDASGATRAECGRVVLGGGDSSSSSSSQNTTNTTNVDKRQVVDGGVGVSSDSSTVTVNNSTLDAGAIQAAMGLGSASLDAVNKSTGQIGASYDRLLTLAGKLFETGSSVLEKSADTTQANIAALETAKNDAAGKVDQKTILIAGGLVVAYAMMKKG